MEYTAFLQTKSYLLFQSRAGPVYKIHEVYPTCAHRFKDTRIPGTPLTNMD